MDSPGRKAVEGESGQIENDQRARQSRVWGGGQRSDRRMNNECEGSNK